MKKVLILLNYRQPAPFIDYLKKELGAEKVVLGYFSQLCLKMASGKVAVFWQDQPLSDFDLVYFRRPGGEFADLTKALAIYCEREEIRYFNRAWGKNLVGDKVGDLVRLAYASLPVPPSVFCRPENLPADFAVYPLVAKTTKDHAGYGVKLLKDKSELSRLPKQMFVFQQFYPNDGDWRLLVLDGRLAVAEKRIRGKDEFRNNAHLGGREVFYKVEEIPEKLKQIAVRAAAVLDLQVAGVDVLVDSQTGKEWLLEVNPKPTFTADLNLSPELPVMAEFFREKLKG